MDVVELIAKLNEYGPPGLFLISFISNVIPGFPAIYLAFVGSYAIVASDTMHATLAIVVSGLGAGLGKLALFMSSRALGHASKSLQKVREKTEWLGEEGEKGVFILVLLFAALPLPDDILYIPLGLTGFRAVSFAVSVVLGKIILTTLVFMLGRAYKTLFESITAAQAQQNLGLLVGGMLVASIIATIVIFSMDWRRIYLTYKKKGSLKATILLLIELIRVITFNQVGGARKTTIHGYTAISLAVILGALIGWIHWGWQASILLGLAALPVSSMLLWLIGKSLPSKPPASRGEQGE